MARSLPRYRKTQLRMAVGHDHDWSGSTPKKVELRCYCFFFLFCLRFATGRCVKKDSVDRLEGCILFHVGRPGSSAKEAGKASGGPRIRAVG